MDAAVLDDLRYRIQNLKEAIRHIDSMGDAREDWEGGYRAGSIYRMESELRFLQGLIGVRY